MRILYICNEYPPAVHGGIGVFVQTLAERLAGLGHEIAVIGYGSHVRESAESIENGVRVVRLPWPRGGPVLGLGLLRIDSSAVASRRNLSRQAARFAKRFRPDLVESHDWSGPLWTAPCRPLVVRLHGASSVLKALRSERAPRLMRFLERRNVRMADQVIGASHFIGRSTMDVFKLSGKPFTTLYHGVDTDWFRPDESARRPNEVLFVGTVKRQKGIQELFRAIPGILEEAPAACFTIAGRYPVDASDSCSPQSLLKTLLGLASSAAPEAHTRIRFLGQVSRQQLRDLYGRAAVAVFPSHGEAFGLACAEAMSCGAAVVAADCGSVPELVAAGECGLLVQPRDSGGLGAAVVRLLKDEDQRRRLGTAARRWVVENFRLSDAAARNLAFYEQIASRFAKQQTAHA